VTPADAYAALHDAAGTPLRLWVQSNRPAFDAAVRKGVDVSQRTGEEGGGGSTMMLASPSALAADKLKAHGTVTAINAALRALGFVPSEVQVENDLATLGTVRGSVVHRDETHVRVRDMTVRRWVERALAVMQTEDDAALRERVRAARSQLALRG